MAEFVTVGKAEDFAVGEARSFEAGGRVVAVARTAEGWHAFDNACTHQLCSLAEGEIEGDIVVCPCHGSEFALATGEVMNGPADEPIRTFEVRVQGDELQVAL
jgi:nitrite reductase/ring-hydroxylating ferredoxin subunit